jgi:nucleoporin NUP42
MGGIQTCSPRQRLRNRKFTRGSVQCSLLIRNQALLEQNAIASVKGKIDAALKDFHGAARYINQGYEGHPNRLDIMKGSLAAGSSPFSQQPVSSNPFGASSRPPVAAFGQPSAMATSSPLARVGAFGQPSAPGNPSPFGAPSKAVGGFGQPSALGQASPFGQPQSAVGGGQQATPFGQPTNKPNPFGQPTQAPANPFGQPKLASPFGQPSQVTASPFSQAANANPFGQQPAAAAAAPSVAAANPFGQPSQAPAANANPFGQPASNPFGSQPAQTASPFGSNQQSNPQLLKPFGNPAGQPTAARPFGNISNGNSSGSSFQRGGSLAQNREVFPSGIPTVPCVDDPPDWMYGEHEQLYKEAYEYCRKHGRFKDNIMPMLPPKAAWITYDGI